MLELHKQEVSELIRQVEYLKIETQVVHRVRIILLHHAQVTEAQMFRNRKEIVELREVTIPQEVQHETTRLRGQVIARLQDLHQAHL